MLFFITGEKKNNFSSELKLKLITIYHLKFTVNIMKILWMFINHLLFKICKYCKNIINDNTFHRNYPPPMKRLAPAIMLLQKI